MSADIAAGSAAGEVLLSVQGVQNVYRKEYGPSEAVRDLTFSVHRCDFT